MDILKPISLLLSCLLLFSCWRSDKCSNESYSRIGIYDWNNKPLPKKGKIIVYKKGSDFKEIIQEGNRLSTSYMGDLKEKYNTNGIRVKFSELEDFYPTNDYQLILDDTLVYKISNIETTVFSGHHTMGGAMKICTIKSMIINNKVVDTPRIFEFSRNTRLIVKK